MTIDLAPCPVCQREVSVDATHCPGCGHPLAPELGKPRLNTRLLVLAGLVVAAGTAVGIVAATGILSSNKAPSRQLAGRLELTLGTIASQVGSSAEFTFENGSVTIQPSSSPCHGLSGYDEIHEGTQVTVSDSAGKVIGSGTLGPGSVPDPTVDNPVCTFTFDIGKVPDSPFYKLEVAHRGQVTFTRQEVLANDVALTLGKA